MIALPVLGLWHLWSGAPSAPADRQRSAGFIGFAIGGPLSDGVTPWIATPLLIIAALFGVLLLSGTTIRELPETLYAMFGTRGGQAEYGDYYDDFDEADARYEGAPRTSPTATTTTRGPTPRTSRRRGRARQVRSAHHAGQLPTGRRRHRRHRAHQVAPQEARPGQAGRQTGHRGDRPRGGGPYTLPSLDLLIAGDPPKRRSARQRADGRLDHLRAATVQGRRRGHRLHPWPDRHPLRGGTRPRCEGREDHCAATQHRLRGGHRVCGCWRRYPASPPSASRCPTPTAKWCAWPTFSPRRPPAATTTRWSSAGQGHRRRLHLSQSREDAAPAGGRVHRLRQVELRELDAGLAARPRHPRRGADDPHRPQDGGADALRRHSAPDHPDHHPAQEGGRRAGLAGGGDGAALPGHAGLPGAPHRRLQPEGEIRRHLSPRWAASGCTSRIPTSWRSSTSWPT